MHKKILITLVLALATTTISWACSCRFAGPFMEVYQQTELTVIGKVIKKTNAWTMEVEVTTYLQGTSEKKRITILGDRTGASCLRSLHTFKEGQTYAFAINTGSRKNQYLLNNCGEYALEIAQEQVQGRITQNHLNDNPHWPQWNGKTMDLAEFLELFQ